MRKVLVLVWRKVGNCSREVNWCTSVSLLREFEDQRNIAWCALRQLYHRLMLLFLTTYINLLFDWACSSQMMAIAACFLPFVGVLILSGPLNVVDLRCSCVSVDGAAWTSTTVWFKVSTPTSLSQRQHFSVTFPHSHDLNVNVNG